MTLDEARKIAGLPQLGEGPMMKDRSQIGNLKLKSLVGKYPQAEDAIRKAYALGLADASKD